MLGALIGCGLAAVGGAAIGSYLGTARGVETGLRIARRCGGYGGASYGNRAAYERDRKLLLQQLAKRDAENREFKDFMLRMDAKLDRVAKFENIKRSLDNVPTLVNYKTFESYEVLDAYNEYMSSKKHESLFKEALDAKGLKSTVPMTHSNTIWTPKNTSD